MNAMNHPDWAYIWETFDAAVQIADERNQRRFVEETCVDVEMRKEVLSLLNAHRTESLLDRPAIPTLPPRVGPYLLVQEIGRGGMGVVHRAYDERLYREVALKMLPAHLSADPEAKARLVGEARNAAGLEHPNIATVYDIGEAEDGSLYFAMALYEGETLARRIGTLSVPEAVALARQVACGLQHAHERHVVHRDIKPSNILITDDGTVKILDFGIAKGVDLGLTRAGTTVGTVAYMSPEQARGEPVDHRSDIWSLGVVLYEMLTGRRPFDGSQRDAVMHCILHKTPAPPRTVRPDVPAGLERLVMHALQRDPADRLPNAQAFIEALDRYEEDGESTARVFDAPERARAAVVAGQIVGLVDVLDEAGPAAAAQVSNLLRERIETVTASYEGLVYEMESNAFVALFGVPIAHEDDFLRGARAARDLRDAVEEGGAQYGVTLRLAAGVDVGPVVAHQESGGLKVSGAAIQLARHLSHLAAAGEIVVSPDTHRLVRSFFDTRAGEPTRLKGSRAAVTPYVLEGETGSETRIDAAQRAGMTPHTGRDHELDALVRAFERTRAGAGGIVAVVGDAGLGKSRLLYEFRRHIEKNAGVDDVQILSGRCLPHRSKIPYLPFVDVLRTHLKLRDRSDALSEEDVVRHVESIGQELSVFLPLYLHLLSIETDDHAVPDHLKGEDLRMAMIEALSGVFTLSARQRPLVLLLEDWHWADEASSHVLRQLSELAASHTLLVVVTYRPAYHDAEIADARLLQLKPLDRPSSAAIIRAVFQADTIPDDLIDLIHGRTGGNPFFLEEVSRALVEEGLVTVEDGRAVPARRIDQLELPDTVQAVIRVRLHRLDPSARRILRNASVVGRDFSRAVLDRMMPETSDLTTQLDALGRLGLIQKTAVLPEVTYRFKHALTQEVVYDSLLHHQRKSLHGHVGEAIETLSDQRRNERLDVLVHHFSRAESWQKAAYYGRRAAQRSMQLSQFPEAATMLEDVLEWIRLMPESSDRRDELIDTLLEYERVCETLGDRAHQEAILAELLSLLQPGGSLALQAEVYRRRGDLDVLRRRLDVAAEALETAMELAHRSGDEDVVRRTLRSIGFLRWIEGRSEEAVAVNEELLRLHRESGDDRAVIGDLVNLCIIKRDDGRYEEALAYLEDARTEIERLESPSVEAYIVHSLGMLYHLSGDSELALAHLDRACEIAEQHRLPLQHSFDLMSIAHIHLSRGDIDLSIQHYEKAIELTRRSRYADGLAKALNVFGQVLKNLERYGDAIPYLREAADWFKKLEDVQAEADTLKQLADACEKEGRLDEAEEAWTALAELLEDLDVSYEIDAIEAFGRLARARGRMDEAASYYHDAVELARRADRPKREAHLLNSAGILAWKRGAYADAVQLYERALAIFQTEGDESGEGLMLNSIASCLLKLERYDAALEHLERSVACLSAAEDDVLLSHALSLKGDVLAAAGRPDEALSAYSDSLELRWHLNDRAGEGWMLQRIGSVYRARDEIDRCTDYARQALAIADELGEERLRRRCEALID